MDGMNGILLVDKPQGWTSHDVVAKLRGALHERRIGHAGTLDPMATGLLVVFVGRATKAVEFAEADKKRYIAGLRLGVETDTQDTTGNILTKKPVDVSQEKLDRTLEAFRGEIDQIPPMYSAIKIDGVRLYKMARKGQEIERSSRKITIHALERIAPLEGDETVLDVTCSKGTYIRALCADIGAALDCGGAMSSLRRTEAGAFNVGQASTVEEICALAGEGRAEELLLPVDSLFSAWTAYTASLGQERLVRNGCPFDTDAPEGDYRVLSQSGDFLMLARCAQGRMCSIKNFF
ncbi:MAG: tRNA pseudouridine(55) synthase TruB [Candidatus Heteroscillospira sp.]|jgi:tRNA pseudouridine55 synthase